MARHSFGVSEGSKGGVGLLLRIHDSTVAFISVHMASKKQDLRFAQCVHGVLRLFARHGYHLTVVCVGVLGTRS